MARTGGYRPGAGRKPLAEETKLFKNLYEYLPQAKAFLDECFAGNNARLKQWATERVLNKCIPDMKAVELTGQHGGPIQLYINAGAGFIPATISAFTASTTSDAGESTAVQSVGVAPESAKNDDSNHGAGQAGTP